MTGQLAHASVVEIARRFSFVRETLGPNRGAWVQFIQRFTGGVPGESWCCDLASLVLDIAYFGRPPLRKTSSCAAMLAEADGHGWIVDAPAVGDLVFSVDANHHAHHVGFLTALAPLTSTAGNTSPDGTSADGTGDFEHPISAVGKVFVRLP